MSELNGITELHEMLNIGLGFEKELKEVGIQTPDDLRRIGSKEAYRRLKEAGVQNLNINKLASLQGAIDNVKKYALSSESREDIEEFYFEYEK
ncbi:MAG: TfoX/Sxy family DNA transformation protein [Eubacterium sp.]